jgi:RNA polymerase sigma-70 factor (ECF subfamily)
MNGGLLATVLAFEHCRRNMTGHSEQIGLGETVLADEQDIAGCEERFAALVGRQSRFIFRVAYAVLRNSHDAEDVVQEVFLKLYRSARWDQMKDERAYLARVAWRISVDRLPKTRDSEVDAEELAGGETPEQAAVQANWSAVVHRLIDALPEELRHPLALSSIDELKSHEIARILGIPEGTVRTRLMKARAVLKQKLALLMGGRCGSPR